MAYFNYHAKIKSLLQGGHLTDYKFFSNYHNISPALVLYFDCNPPMPVREHMFDYYLNLIDNFFNKDNNSIMIYKIKVLSGTKLKTNNYLIETDKSAVLIEASANVEDIKSAIEGKCLKAILLTHGHWDHYFFLEEIIKEFGVKCYLSVDALKKMQIDERGNWLKKINLPDSNFIFVKDGDIINIDELSFKVISTPGHTNCSLCYVLDKNIFSGDTMFFECYGRCDLPTANEIDMQISLNKLLSLSGDYLIYPGHDKPTTLIHEKKFYGRI